MESIDSNLNILVNFNNNEIVEIVRVPSWLFFCITSEIVDRKISSPLRQPWLYINLRTKRKMCITDHRNVTPCLGVDALEEVDRDKRRRGE